MNKFRRFASLIMAAVILLSVSGCSLPFQHLEKFDDFCEQIFIDTLAGDRFSSHYIAKDVTQFGVEYTEDDYTLGEIDYDNLDESYKYYESVYNTLKKYDYNQLTEQQQLTYDCLKKYLENQLAFKGTDKLQNLFGPNSGLLSNLSINFVEYNFLEQKDVDDYLKFLSIVDEYMDMVFEFIKRQSEDGYFMPDYIVDKTINYCEQYLDAEEDPLEDSFKAKLNKLALDDDTKKAYIDKHNKILREEYNPIYKKTIEALTKLRGTCKNDGGLVNFGKAGKKYYEAIVQDKTSSDMSPKQLIEYIDGKVSDTLKKYSAILMIDEDALTEFNTYDPETESPDEVVKYVLEKYRNDFPSEVTNTYNIDFQSEACQIDNVLAYYLTAPIDDIDYNCIKVNGSLVGDDLKELYNTLAHEGYPGHLYQFTTFYSSDVPNSRKILDFIGATEGWAQYAASVCFDYLDMSDNAQKVMLYEEELNYLIMGRIDVGVNYEGWDKADTREYLQDFYGADIEDSSVEYYYYAVIGDPGTILPYGVGLAKMLDLRERAEKKLGSKFSLYKFHQFINSCGIAPFSVYESRLNSWIATQK